ncbi:MAG: ATP-binding protein [Chloroflexus sp.]|uniref:ATP-binding protein n=1 Tax=Chloroflexus sp. TaxID=1904827 RepID=UPI00404B000F
MKHNTWQLQTIIRRLLPLPALGIGWLLTQFSLPSAAWGGLIGYGLVNVALLLLLRRHPTSTNRLLTLAGLSDLLMIIWSIFLISTSPLLAVVQGVGALRAWRYRFHSLWPALLPALIGLLYPFTTPSPWTNNPLTLTTLVPVGSFLLSIITVLALVWFGQRRNLVALDWRARYDQLRREQKQQVAGLEASNNDLRERLRRMEALGESLRAISSSLSLDDVLRQILDSLTHMLGVQRIDNVALTLARDNGLEHQILHNDAQQSDWATALAQGVITEKRTVLLDAHEIVQEPAWQSLTDQQWQAALSVPLFDPNQPDRIRGALSVVSRQSEVFSPAEERHLTSFSIQAMIAIRNAELHIQLSRQQAMLSAILHDMADGLIVYDEAGNVYLDNAVARQAIAHSQACNGRLADHLIDTARQLYQSKVSFSKEIIDGEAEQARWHQIHATLVNPSPDTCLAVLVLHDITDQKVQEEQRREFIGKLAHELRNPLNVLNGNLDIVLKESDNIGKLTEAQRLFLGEVKDSYKRLWKRIEELIEINRHGSSQLKLRPVRTNIIDIIITTCVQQQQPAKSHGVDLRWEVPDQLPDMFLDEERIGQVLTNLIENAIKAMPDGGQITVSAEQQQDCVLVHVTDTGIGIPADQIEKVFLPYHQVPGHSNGRETKNMHLGLGLAICKQFVEAHNGRIWISHSEVGKGTRFTFSLPIMPETEQTIKTGSQTTA